MATSPSFSQGKILNKWNISERIAFFNSLPSNEKFWEIFRCLKSRWILVLLQQFCGFPHLKFSSRGPNLPEALRISLFSPSKPSMNDSFHFSGQRTPTIRAFSSNYFQLGIPHRKKFVLTACNTKNRLKLVFQVLIVFFCFQLSCSISFPNQ